MIGLFRFIGIINGAIWFGSTFFYVVIAGPAYFSAEMKLLLGRFFPVYADPFSLVLLGKYYVLQKVCGTIALVYLLWEWLYFGKTLPRMLLYCLVAVFAFGVLGGYAVQPKMKEWHNVKHLQGYTQDQRKSAANSFAALRGFVHVTNAFACLTLMFYVWRLNNPTDAPRFGKKR